MDMLKRWIENVLLKRIAASATQFIVSFSTAHALGSAGTLADLHWAFAPLGIDLVLKLTIDPVAFESGLFLFMIAATEWARHRLAERYPDRHWL